MGGKSGQQQQRPRRSAKSGGEAKLPAFQGLAQGANMLGGGGSTAPSSGKSGKSGGQMQQPMYGAMQNGMSAWGQPNKWQNYAGMTANPAPSMPPQVGAPQTGAFPFGQQPTQGIVANQPAAQTPQQGQQGQAGKPDWRANRVQRLFGDLNLDPSTAKFQVAPNEGNRYQVDPGFYNAVMSTLGQKTMATQGQYDKGWNRESNPNSRAQAKEYARTMAQALGRPLTNSEIGQLESYVLGWGFYGPGTSSVTGKKLDMNGPDLGQIIAGIIQGKDMGQPSFGTPQASTNPNELAWLKQYQANGGM